MVVEALNDPRSRWRVLHESQRNRDAYSRREIPSSSGWTDMAVRVDGDERLYRHQSLTSAHDVSGSIPSAGELRLGEMGFAGPVLNVADFIEDGKGFVIEPVNYVANIMRNPGETHQLLMTALHYFEIFVPY